MFNGEETIIGGLFINEEVKVRSGIPFLKDLPWWVFGIRYLTGSDETRVNKKELVILIKAELVPVLKDRVTSVKSTSPIKDEVYRLRDDIRYYQFNENK
jgi:type IV pilus assembly protein PilQ